MDRTVTAGHLHGFRWYRRSRLWVVPSAGVVAALVLAAASLSADHFLIEEGAPFPIFSGQPDTARTILSLIATSVVALTALVLTIVAVVIQLATQALSPRAVRTFLQDPTATWPSARWSRRSPTCWWSCSSSRQRTRATARQTWSPVAR